MRESNDLSDPFGESQRGARGGGRRSRRRRIIKKQEVGATGAEAIGGRQKGTPPAAPHAAASAGSGPGDPHPGPGPGGRKRMGPRRLALRFLLDTASVLAVHLLTLPCTAAPVLMPPSTVTPFLMPLYTVTLGLAVHYQVDPP